MLNKFKKESLTKHKKFFYTIIAVVILVGLHTLQILSPLENLIVQATNPIRTMFYEQSDRYIHIFSNWQTISELEKENDTLRDKISHLTSQVNSLLSIASENEELRKQLKIQPKSIKELVEAKPIQFVNDDTDNYMIVDVGFKEGLSSGLPAILYESLIGTVSSTTAHSARINLLSNPDNPIQASIQGKPEAKGIVSGLQQDLLLLSNIQKNIKLEIGDQVISSGGERDQFNNLLIGTIIEDSTKKADIYQSFKVEPTVKIRPVDRVFIVLP